MLPRRRLVTSLGSIFMLVLLAGTWLVFAPTQLGGHTSYVIINGNSMEPGMHRGDLAVVRGAPAYREGEIVTYRHPQIGNVIHRIIGRDGERYLLQGDHNDFIDAYHPSHADFIGKLWFHVPEVGTWLSRIHSPIYATALLFVAFVGLGGGTLAATQQRRRHGRRTRRGTPRRTPIQPLSKNWQDALSIIGVVGLGFAVLAFVAFRKPETRAVPDELSYRQSGTLEYSAAARSEDVYDTGAATTGEPVYRRLSDEVDFRFTYTVAAKTAALATAQGSYRLVAEVSDGSGWKRTVELASGPFSDVPFAAAGTLKFSQLETLIEALETQTGVQNEGYTVTIASQVDTSGSFGGEAFQTVFSSALKMSLDPLTLKMAPSAGEAGDPLAPVKDGLLEGVRSQANTVGLPLFDMSVASARWISVGGLGIILCAAGVYVVAAVRTGASIRGTEDAPGLRLKDSLVRVSGVPLVRARTIDVASLEDLTKISQKEACVILQEARPGYHAYFVHLGDTTYRHQAVGRRKDGAWTSTRPGNAA